ncbi:MAG: MinD/ParA family protein [Deltaproteobacteria bacterium]|nr:MinD/ParA family protein [Deltaproteobacteria bacterium]
MHQADTLEKIMDRNQSPRPRHAAAAPGRYPRVICVTSGKGGVGKTNIVANLAYCLTRLGQRVVVLDADLNLANIDVLLGLTPRYNLNHVFLGEKTLREIMVTGPGGIAILPASSGVLELAELTEEQKLYFLAEMAELGDSIDILLIDTAAGINKNVIYFTLAAEERIIVLTPEPTSLTDAYAMIKVLSTRHDVKRFRILVNSAQSEKEGLAVFRQLTLVADRFLDTLSLDYLGCLPYDKKLPQAVRAQRLVTELSPHSPVAAMFHKLAKVIAEEQKVSQADGNIKFFWKGLLDL